MEVLPIYYIIWPILYFWKKGAIWSHVFHVCPDVSSDSFLRAYLLELLDLAKFFYLARIHLGKFIYSLIIPWFSCGFCRDMVYDQGQVQTRLLLVSRNQIRKRNHFWIKFLVPYRQESHWTPSFVDCFLDCESWLFQNLLILHTHFIRRVCFLVWYLYE